MSNIQRELLDMEITLTPKEKKKKPTLEIKMEELRGVEFDRAPSNWSPRKALTSADDIFGRMS